MSINKSLSRSERTIINLFTSGLAWGWPVLLAFIITPMVVKGLGNDAYGIRSLVLSITGYFALLDLGLNGAVTKYLAEFHALDDKEQLTELLGTTLTTYTVFGLIGGFSIWVFAEVFVNNFFSIPPQFHEQSVWAFRLSGIGFFLSMITWWGSSIPTGLQRFDIFNGISIGFGTLTIIGTLMAVLLGYGLLGVIWANLLSNFIAIVAYLIIVHKLLPQISIHFTFSWGMFKRTILFGLYMVAFRIFGLLFSQMDTLLIGSWLGTAAITFYIVPQQVAQIVNGLNGKMMQIIFPMVSELDAIGDKEKIELVYVRGLNLTVIIGLTLAIPLFVLAQPLLRYWMSPAMAMQSATIMQVMVIAFLLVSLSAHMTSFLGGLNFPHLVTIGAIVVGVSSFIFFLLLIKPLGILGATLGKLMGVIVMIIYYFIVCEWVGKVRFARIIRVIWKPISIAIVEGLVIYIFLVPLLKNLLETILGAMFISGLFLFICWKIEAFDYKEKQSFIKLIKRLTKLKSA